VGFSPRASPEVVCCTLFSFALFVLMCYNVSMERELKKDPRVKELFEVIVHLEDPVECARFFRDLCTLTELKAMAERWQVVQLVSEDIPYREISERTGASTATITRIARWLKYGEGGYRFMLERVRKKNEVRR